MNEQQPNLGSEYSTLFMDISEATRKEASETYALLRPGIERISSTLRIMIVLMVIMVLYPMIVLALHAMAGTNIGVAHNPFAIIVFLFFFSAFGSILTLKTAIGTLRTISVFEGWHAEVIADIEMIDDPLEQVKNGSLSLSDAILEEIKSTRTEYRSQNDGIRASYRRTLRYFVAIYTIQALIVLIASINSSL